MAALLQLDEAIDAATREWTLAAFAIFVWLVTLGVGWWIVRGKNQAIDDLAKENARLGAEARKDLQAAITRTGGDAARVEAGLQTAASATDALQQEFRELRQRIDARFGRGGSS